MTKTEPSEMEKSYRGFQIHVERNCANAKHPFTVTWEDRLATYHPIPSPMVFQTSADAFQVAGQLIDLQYQAEAQSACQYFNPGEIA